MGNAVDVPGNADRINKTENQHDPQRYARKKVKHAEEIDAVKSARRDGDDVPTRMGKDPGVGLRTFDRGEIARTGCHSFRSQCLGIHNFDR